MPAPASPACGTAMRRSGVAAGPIICEEQLRRHYEDCEQFDRQYIFVMYEGREWRKGKYHYLPIRMGRRGQNVLRRFLVWKLRKVYVLHVSVIWAIYEYYRRQGSIQEYMMQRGLKRYIKVPDADLKRIANDIEALSQYGLSTADYTLNRRLEMARFRQFKVPTEVVRITCTKSLDDSFDVGALEVTGA